jgi:hypothetical protein
MELASMLAGEPFSDRPHAVCPVVAGFLRSYNDGLDDDRRQDLYRYASRAVGTRASREVATRRRLMCADRAARGMSWLRALLGSSSGAGQAAARTFLERPETHEEALAFVDRLIEAPELPMHWDEGELREAASNLARLDSA